MEIHDKNQSKKIGPDKIIKEMKAYNKKINLKMNFLYVTHWVCGVGLITFGVYGLYRVWFK